MCSVCVSCSVADVSTCGVDVEVTRRSAANGLGVALGVESIQMSGLGQNLKDPPNVVSTKKKTDGVL